MMTGDTRVVRVGAGAVRVVGVSRYYQGTNVDYITGEDYCEVVSDELRDSSSTFSGRWWDFLSEWLGSAEVVALLDDQREQWREFLAWMLRTERYLPPSLHSTPDWSLRRLLSQRLPSSVRRIVHWLLPYRMDRRIIRKLRRYSLVRARGW